MSLILKYLRHLDVFYISILVVIEELLMQSFCNNYRNSFPAIISITCGFPRIGISKFFKPLAKRSILQSARTWIKYGRIQESLIKYMIGHSNGFVLNSTVSYRKVMHVLMDVLGG